MTKIIDYGLGNIQAIVNVFKRLHLPVAVARSAEEIFGSEKLILPGVGAFDHAMERFEASGMRTEVESLVQKKKVPILGICVGMQMLADKSEEGQAAGLGWIPGDVRPLKSRPELEHLPLPHMGWNDVVSSESCRLFKGIEHDARFYFLHSYYYECKKIENVAANVDYGGSFCCAVKSDNIFGVQFHPEKSHQYGEALLKNFAEL
jgi:glutamine amidotransferase